MSSGTGASLPKVSSVGIGMHVSCSYVHAESYSARLKTPGRLSVPAKTSNHWHLAGMLHLAIHPLFALPGDKPRTSTKAAISMQPLRDRVVIKSERGIALVTWTRNGRLVREEDMRARGLLDFVLKLDEVHKDFDETDAKREDKETPVKIGLTVTAGDGAQKTIEDFWEYTSEALVTLPGCEFVVKKKSVMSGGPEGSWGVWRWAVLLTKLGEKGQGALIVLVVHRMAVDRARAVIRAKKLQIQRGAWFDGVYAHYEDGTREIMGAKTTAHGGEMQLGGSTTWLSIGEDETIKSLKIRAGEYGFVNEVKFVKGEVAGAVPNGMEELNPDEGEKISESRPLRLFDLFTDPSL